MKKREQVPGSTYQGKARFLFSDFLTPNTGHWSRASRGFSLIEMIVAVALFAVIMLVAIGALLSLVEANRKARALESVMNNLNISLDSMVRAARMGTKYNCGGAGIPSATDGADCTSGIQNGSVAFSFAPFGSNSCAERERYVYSFSDGALWRSLDGGDTPASRITAPEVLIEDMQFYVVGSKPGNAAVPDTTQPKVVVVVKGTAGGQDARIRSTFNIQATAVQRELDIGYTPCN